MMICACVFFFQAEDGIRDYDVTGVQTCALPIYVGKIINENCVVCHREGGIGPMQLSNYDQVRPWAPLIQLRVASREMPPYAYDHGIGIQDLQGDWRLEQEEIDTIVAWVNRSEERRVGKECRYRWSPYH